VGSRSPGRGSRFLVGSWWGDWRENVGAGNFVAQLLVLTVMKTRSAACWGWQWEGGEVMQVDYFRPILLNGDK
jgi:hypothetical protein